MTGSMVIVARYTENKIPAAWARRNVSTTPMPGSGAGSMPAFLEGGPIPSRGDLIAEAGDSPWIRGYPHPGFLPSQAMIVDSVSTRWMAKPFRCGRSSGSRRFAMPAQDVSGLTMKDRPAPRPSTRANAV